MYTKPLQTITTADPHFSNTCSQVSDSLGKLHTRMSTLFWPLSLPPVLINRSMQNLEPGKAWDKSRFLFICHIILCQSYVLNTLDHDMKCHIQTTSHQVTVYTLPCMCGITPDSCPTNTYVFINTYGYTCRRSWWTTMN